MLTVHLGTLALTLLVIIYTDHLGWQYFRGTKEVLDAKVVKALHYLVWAGLVFMIASGLYMAWPGLPFLVTMPLFLTKVAFVAVLVVNALFIGRFISVATTTPFAELTLKQRTPLMVSGVVSSVSWIGAILAAMFLFGTLFAWAGISW